MNRLALCALLTISGALLRAQPAGDVFPGTSWESVATPESVGFSAARLEAARAWTATLDTTALMVVVGGRTLLSYGETTHVSYLASGRKSVLSLLYGRYVENGTIGLSRTLADLDVTDEGGLLPIEQRATVDHLLMARSGVYHRASNGGDDLAHAPPRGSVPPGSRYLYNNWDFNAAGAVFERLSGRDIYDALEADLAGPLGMQDFDRRRQVKNGDASASRIQAYPIWLSTRDMARIGLLALRGGRWRDRQLVPAEWIRRTTTLVSPWAEMDQKFDDSPPTAGRWGYGRLWWVWDAADEADPLAGAFTAWGVGGQYITVVPKLDMVVAHKTDVGVPPGGPAFSQRSAAANGRAVLVRQYDVLLHMLVGAKIR